MLIGCKFRIYPNKKQEEILFNYCFHAHNLWNFVVAKYKDKDLPIVNKLGVKGLSATQLKNEYQNSSTPIPERIYKDILCKYGRAVERVYHKTAKRPRFHKFNYNKQSFCICGRNYQVFSNYTISMPKVQGISFSGFTKIKADKKYLQKFQIKEIKEPRFTYKKGKWFVSGSYEAKEPQKQEKSSIIGLDWGIKNFMTTSTGIFINYPKSVVRQFYRINRLKSIRDKKIKGSNNWIKMNSKITRAYERFENLKKDFIEQTTTKLCKDNNIAIEDLTNAKIKMSSKNRRRLMQISPLNRFTEKLEWKCKKFETEFYKVNPAYTSQTCSCCGKINTNLTLKDRAFKCLCGNIIDRDINAAINIATKAGHRSLQRPQHGHII